MGVLQITPPMPRPRTGAPGLIPQWFVGVVVQAPSPPPLCTPPHPGLLCSAGRGLGRAQKFLRKDWEWRKPHLSRAPSVLHTCSARPIPSPTIPLPILLPRPPPAVALSIGPHFSHHPTSFPPGLASSLPQLNCRSALRRELFRRSSPPPERSPIIQGVSFRDFMTM